MNSSSIIRHAKASMALLSVAFFVFSCKHHDSPDDVYPTNENGFISVVDVSGQASLPGRLLIDGLEDNSTGIDIGSSKQPAPYQHIAAGVRNFSLGDYQDTVHVQKDNYYTLMLYDNDSVQFVYDGQGENVFVAMPMVRWNIVGRDDVDAYQVNIYGDSLINDVKPNIFTPFSEGEGKVKVHLYHRNNLDQELGTKEVAIANNQKITINIQYDPATKKYVFNPITQTIAGGQ